MAPVPTPSPFPGLELVVVVVVGDLLRHPPGDRSPASRSPALITALDRDGCHLLWRRDSQPSTRHGFGRRKRSLEPGLGVGEGAGEVGGRLQPSASAVPHDAGRREMERSIPFSCDLRPHPQGRDSLLFLLRPWRETRRNPLNAPSGEAKASKALQSEAVTISVTAAVTESKG